MSANPFTPVFGKVPAYLAGRTRIIDDMLKAFEPDGPRANPDLCSLFVGARGAGKTALLAYVGMQARQLGWIVVDVTASDGMLEDICERAVEGAAHLVDATPGKKLTGIGVAPVGSLSWTAEPSAPANWRSRMNSLLDQLARTDTGLLITVDEVDPSLPEMTQLVTTYQHFVREDRRVALVMAGLPHKVSGLLSGQSTSFLRRAARHTLGPIPSYEVEEAFRLTANSGGRDIDDDALALAADAINGFPFMFQLVGYRAWNVGDPDRPITERDVEHGSRLALEELRERVFDATLAELSAGDVAFLKAMAVDEGPTRRADLAQRLGKSTSHVSTYKRRLLESGVIDEPRRGTLVFCLPGFRDYIRELEL